MATIYITSADLMILEKRPNKLAARRAFGLIRAALGKSGRNQWVTIAEYAAHRGITETEITNALKPKQDAKK